jgi:hypothetical protein
MVPLINPRMPVFNSMATATLTQSVLEHELDRMDSRHLHDLALIGLDRVQGNAPSTSPQITDEIIDQLKSSFVAHQNK